MVLLDTTNASTGTVFGLGDLLVSSPSFGTVGGNYYSTIADTGRNSGRYYWEFYPRPLLSGELFDIGVGVSKQFTTDSWPTLGGPHVWPASGGPPPESSTVYRGSTGSLLTDRRAYGPLFNSGVNNVIGVLLDLDMGILQFNANGTLLDQATTSLTPGMDYFPWIGISRGTVLANFGLRPFQFPIPAGYDPYGGNGLSDFPPGTFPPGIVSVTLGVAKANAESIPGNIVQDVEAANKFTQADRQRINTTRFTGNFSVLGSVLSNCRLLCNTHDIKQGSELDPTKTSGRLRG